MAEEDRERERALDRAVRALARRDRSAGSLRVKLDAAGIAEPVREEALRTLEEAGYVDDRRFAADRAMRLVERGWSDAWIRTDLEREGVAQELIEKAVAGLEPERDRARRLVTSLGGDLRAVSRLARRGFSEDSLESVLGALVADPPRGGVP